MREAHPTTSNTSTWQRPKPDSTPCTECRKRRIPCQRPFPCSYCTQNGLEAACLQGSIVKGTRSLKPGAVAMHEDLARMSKQEQELSEALAELQSLISNEPHPLLVRDPQIRTASPVPGLQRLTDIATGDPRETDADEILALGAAMSSLQIGAKQYHGETVSSEHIIKETDAEEEGEIAVVSLPAKRKPPPVKLHPQITMYSPLFPINDEPAPSDMNAFLNELPLPERAEELLDNYHKYFSWNSSFAPVHVTKRETFDIFYPNGKRVQNIQVKKDAQNLALLFMIFLLGTLYDVYLDIEQVSEEMEKFHTLARAAMACYPINVHPSVEGIRAIFLMIWYFRLYPGRQKREYQWALTGILTKAVVAAGLHRDSSRWYTPGERAQYEQTFWEYYCNDIWTSYMFGRPTSMVTLHIDCPRPMRVDVHPEHHPDFFPWKYSFTQLVGDIATWKTVTYEDTLELDKRLREHRLPASIAWPKENEPLPNEPPGKLFQRYITSVWRYAPIFYIHRRWVPELLKSYKTADPTISPYWGSAVAAYESARTLVIDMVRLWRKFPALIERMAPFWSHTGSAAIALGTLVACVPNSDFAADALKLLDQTCEMFATSTKSLQPPGVFEIMRRLQMKARYAFHREQRELSVRDEDIEMTVLPSEIYFPYSFGDQPTSSPEGDAPPTSVVPSVSDVGAGRPVDVNLSVNGVNGATTYTNGYNTSPPITWGDITGTTLPHVVRRY